MYSATDRPTRIGVRASRLFRGRAERPLPDGFAVIDGSQISLVDCGISLPADVHFENFGDATILPGLIDPHVHLVFDASSDPVDSLIARSDAQVLESVRRAAGAALAVGITTLRDLGDRNYLALSVQKDEALPTIIASGPPITTKNGHCHYLGGAVSRTHQAIRAAVQERYERGVDIIKIMAGGGLITAPRFATSSQFDLEDLIVATNESHRLGLPITAHAHGTRTIADAVSAGVDGIEHASFWSGDGVFAPDQLLEEIVARQFQVCTTIGWIDVPDAPATSVELVRRRPEMWRVTKRLIAMGGNVVAGTDAGIAPRKPHGVLPTALQQLALVGMNPMEALTSATSVAAVMCGLGSQKGYLAPGYDADLVIVEGDPLRNLSMIHKVLAVYCRGRRVC